MKICKSIKERIKEFLFSSTPLFRFRFLILAGCVFGLASMVFVHRPSPMSLEALNHTLYLECSDAKLHIAISNSNFLEYRSNRFPFKTGFTDSITDGVTVQKDTIWLDLKKGKTKKIISYPDGKDAYEESLERHQYEGFNTLLNAYVIGSSYWESRSYCMYAKKSGEKLVCTDSEAIINRFPKGKNKERWMLSIYPSPYEPVGTILSIYTINQGNIDSKFEAQYDGWMYADRFTWVNENTIVLKVQNMEAYNNPGDLDEYEYIKLQIF